MSNSLNLSEIIECVKSIVDSVRCTVCDKAEGGRSRHQCGHTTCDRCVTEGCMSCLTPPGTLNEPVPDEPFSRRAINACILLSVCEDTFHLDVYRRSRISEQLKAEKVLFPKCIQAPVKYFNKRKSLAAKSNKENWGRSFYPGEIISQSDSFKMKKCNNYVYQWLNNSENQTRKAFSDLNVNLQNYQKERSLDKSSFNKIEMEQKGLFENTGRKKTISGNLSQKRSYSKNSCAMVGNGNLNEKKFKSSKLVVLEDKRKNNNENDESGIVLDDEPILIENSQSQVLDKDAQALLAVEAANNEQSFIEEATSPNTENIKLPHFYVDPVVEIHKSKKVPFLKKDSLWGCCVDCKRNESTVYENDSKNISITIENNSFITTIKVTNLTENKFPKKIQTNINEIPLTSTYVGDKLFSDRDINKKDIQSQDILLSDLENESNYNLERQEPIIKKRPVESPNIFELCEDIPNKKRCIVIDDSDSDVNSLEVSLLNVTAEVHRSCEPFDYGILTEKDLTENLNTPRNKARGLTPDSNNSSDKENCDPNKKKKRKGAKKNKSSKK